MSAVIRVDGVSKLYRRMAPGYHLRTLKSALLERSLTAGLRPEETIQALDDLSFEVERGEAFGVIGSNGSGKSTLLKILSGILRPSCGTVEVDGRVAALIELGAGFHPEISGRENIYINGVVLGLSRAEIDRRFDDIVEFSGLGDFIDEPVKNYSSGMYVRLGFSVAVHTEPDVLLVDEVLAVGDEAFSHRCLRRIEEFLGSGRTVLLVSHSLGLVEEFCTRALWLDGGRKRALGSPRRVADAYRQAVAEEEGREHQRAKEVREGEIERRERAAPAATEPPSAAPEDAASAPAADGEPEAEPEGEAGSEAESATEPRRWGSRQAEIVGARLVDGGGAERYHFTSGESVTFELDVEAHEELANVVFGIGIFTPRGVECFGTNTHLEGFVSSRLKGRATARLTCESLRLAPGEYLLDVAVHARDGNPYDYHRRLMSFTVTARGGGVGVYFPEHSWHFDGGIDWQATPD
jgi:ABC-type polysaccharide/polyol phosphate transport system ATPase subunit